MLPLRFLNGIICVNLTNLQSVCSAVFCVAQPPKYAFLMESLWISSLPVPVTDTAPDSST